MRDFWMLLGAGGTIVAIVCAALIVHSINISGRRFLKQRQEDLLHLRRAFEAVLPEEQIDGARLCKRGTQLRQLPIGHVGFAHTGFAPEAYDVEATIQLPADIYLEQRWSPQQGLAVYRAVDGSLCAILFIAEEGWRHPGWRLHKTPEVSATYHPAFMAGPLSEV